MTIFKLWLEEPVESENTLGVVYGLVNALIKVKNVVRDELSSASF